jgi:hypothetical protein
MPDTRQLGLDLGAGHDMAVRSVRKIELHPWAKEEVERRLVYRRGGRRPAVGRRMIMPGRIHMRAIVRAQRQAFDRPSFAVGQIGLGQAGKERRDLLPRIFVGHIVDLRAHHRRVGNDIVGDRDR